MGPEDQGVGDLGDLDPQRLGSLSSSLGGLVQDRDLTPDTERCQGMRHAPHGGVVQNVPCAGGTRITHDRTVSQQGSRTEEQQVTPQNTIMDRAA
jgi:hypothetical protein